MYTLFVDCSVRNKTFPSLEQQTPTKSKHREMINQSFNNMFLNLSHNSFCCIVQIWRYIWYYTTEKDPPVSSGAGVSNTFVTSPSDTIKTRPDMSKVSRHVDKVDFGYFFKTRDNILIYHILVLIIHIFWNLEQRCQWYFTKKNIGHL